MRLIFLALLPSIAGLSSTASHAQQVIPAAHFHSVELRGGGDLTIVPGPVQRVIIVHGSTQFTTVRVLRDGKLQIDACNQRCPHNYPLQIRIESPSMPDVAVQAGGTIVAGRGFAPQGDVAAAVSAGGTIDLRAVTADEVSAAVNAGGDIYVHPRISLNAAVNAGGDVHYSGNPQVSMAVSNGGNVSRDN